MEHLGPHLVTVMELENDGFGPDSAAQDFIADLERASGVPWRAVTPADDKVGGDLITVGIFYREDRLAHSGGPSLLTGRDFDGGIRAGHGGGRA